MIWRGNPSIILAQALSSFLVLDMFGLVGWFVCWRSPLVDLSVGRLRCRHRLVAASRSNDSSVCGWYSDGGQRWQTVIGDDVTPRVSGILTSQPDGLSLEIRSQSRLAQPSHSTRSANIGKWIFVGSKFTLDVYVFDFGIQFLYG
jgi:hypothetical protein